MIGRPPIEERSWVPSRERVRLLRAAMGDARFYGAWGRRVRWEVARLRRTRRETNNTAKDCQFMPASLKEARERALSLEAEARSEQPDLQQEAPKTLPAPAEARRRGQAPRPGARKRERSREPGKTASPGLPRAPKVARTLPLAAQGAATSP